MATKSKTNKKEEIPTTQKNETQVKDPKKSRPSQDSSNKVVANNKNIANNPENSQQLEKKPEINKSEPQKYAILETTGLYAAYESLIKSFCKHGLPIGDVYEYSAIHVLNFEKKLKQKEKVKKNELSKSLEKIGILQIKKYPKNLLNKGKRKKRTI